MERHYFMRNELQNLERKVLEFAETPGTNKTWVRTYYRVADAMSNLGAFIAYEANKDICLKVPDEPLKDINFTDVNDLNYLADICYRHNIIIQHIGENIEDTLYNELRIAIRILSYFWERCSVKEFKTSEE